MFIDPGDQQTPRKTLAHQPQQLGQCLNLAGYLLEVHATHMLLSPGEPMGEVSVQPQEGAGPREDGEEEDRLAAENHPEDTHIPDSRDQAQSTRKLLVRPSTMREAKMMTMAT